MNNNNEAKLLFRNNSETTNDIKTNKCSIENENSTKNEKSTCDDKNDITNNKSIITGINQRAAEMQKFDQIVHPDTLTVNGTPPAIEKGYKPTGDIDNSRQTKIKSLSLAHIYETHALHGVDTKNEAISRQDVSFYENKSTEEIIVLMETINKLVKSAQFTPTLGSQIISLYKYLKKDGENMENSHKTELNQVFVSIRQACCREAGQLGTPCRLKMMELIELRAMKWRPSLAHSQYYLDRSTQHQNGAVFPEKMKHPSLSIDNTLEKQERCRAPVQKTPLMSAPISALPYGQIPMHPFAFSMHQANVNSVGAADVMHATSPMTPMSPAPPPSYFLVPAAHASPSGIAFFPSPAQCLLSNAAAAAAASMMHHHNPLSPRFSAPLPAMNQLAAGAMSPMSDFPKGAVIKSSNNLTRPIKIPGKNQFRDEIVIRNADSGKIMGVKGRRVSVIEELSGSIVSFQKVAQNAKERILTITGPNEECILHARLLIEDTIRRNVSPDRGAGKGGELPVRHDLDGSTDSGSGNNLNKPQDSAFAEEHTAGQLSETECALSEMGSILKLSCSDPAVLKVARQALNDYFNRQETTLRRSSMIDGRSAIAYGNKERRKSMPLPLHKLENVAEGNESGSQTPQDCTEPINNKFSITAQFKANARSIPNLLTALHDYTNPPRIFNSMDNHENYLVAKPRIKIVYTRDFLLLCSVTSKYIKAPVLSTDNTDIIHEVLLSNAKIFDVTAYMKKFADFKLEMCA